MTEQQYMQLMAQQRGGQQRQPSPEQQAMMMQQQQMQEGPGAAGGFMGGLLDSALIGLLPNSSYQNPNDPANVGASKMGGLIGMILPMLLAKYGAGKVLSSLASKEGMLANWMGKTAQGVERTTEQLGRADMLASVLGGGIGGGLAEGPVGGLLGAAGMGAYSKFAGAGAAMAPEETYAISKLFGGGKVKPTKEQLKSQAVKNAEVKPTPEELASFKERASKIYDPETKTSNLSLIVDDAKTGFDKAQWGHIKVDGKDVQITPRTVIQKAFSEGADEKVLFKKAKVNPSKDSNVPTYSPEREVTWKEMYDEMVAPLIKGSGKTTPYIPYKANEIASGKLGAKYSTSWQKASQIESKIVEAHKLPNIYSKGEVYSGYTRYAKPVKSKWTAEQQKIYNSLDDTQKIVFDETAKNPDVTFDQIMANVKAIKEPNFGG